MSTEFEISSEIFCKSPRWIDVRAPIEFHQGHLPGAINLPLMNDEERAQVGTLYKEQGSAAAVALGHRLVSGAVKEARVRAWLDAIPDAPRLYCFRGGMRSQIAQQWIAERGREIPRLRGGYKEGRRFLLEQIARISAQISLHVIAGNTGSGKTRLLKAVAARRPTVDLEDLAAHRGSAFGGVARPQPSPANFENLLAVDLMRVEGRGPVLIEDESCTIGRCTLPDPLYHNLVAAPVVHLDEPFAMRVENIFAEYVADNPSVALFENFRRSTEAIKRRLGGALTVEILSDIARGAAAFKENGALDENRVWLAKLLRHYYDPLYEKHLQRRGDKVLFRGSFNECLSFLEQ